MQSLAEWKKFKIKNASASNDSQSTISGVVKKTGKIFFPSFKPLGDFGLQITLLTSSL